MSRCKKDTKTNCFKIISSHFFKKKRNVHSMPERKTCSNEKTFVEPTQFSANKVFINEIKTIYIYLVYIKN